MKKEKAKPLAKVKRPSGAKGLLDIAARVRDRVVRADVGPTWRERIMASRVRDDFDVFAIKAAKLMRDNGELDRKIANQIICDSAFQIAYKRYNDSDSELVRINRAISAAEKRHGLKLGYYWPPGEEPEDVKKLRAAYDRRNNVLVAAILKEYNEDELAAILLADAAAFWRDIFDIDWEKPAKDREGYTGPC